MLKPRIVVADDDELIRELVGFCLSSAGYDVAHAPNGLTALQLIRDLKPSLLILDWVMPDMDGLTVMRRLQRNRDKAQLPVLMLTARGRPEDVREALALGVAGYMVKPFQPEDLLLRVQRLVKGAGVVWPGNGPGESRVR